MEKTPIKSLLTHPNTLTLFRIISVPIIVVLLLMPNRRIYITDGLEDKGPFVHPRMGDLQPW